MTQTDGQSKPVGKTTRRWFAHGYQEAMLDIQDVLDNGGTLDDVKAWVQNNTRPGLRVPLQD